MRDDDLLNELLAGLPRARASAGFTARTLARLDTAPVRRPAAVRWLWTVAAACLFLAAGLGVYSSWRGAVEERERAALRAEQQDLARELAALRSRLDAARPAVVLSNGAGRPVQVDLVELERMAVELRTGPERGILPAVLPVRF